MLELGRAAAQFLAHVGELDDVVRDQPVPTTHQLQRALALTDAALANHQYTDAEDVHQNTVNGSDPHRH